MRSNTPVAVRYILTVYLTGLLFFFLFRLVLLSLHAHEFSNIPGKWGIITYSLFMGLRFDTTVSGYILLLPTAITVVCNILNWKLYHSIIFTNAFVCAMYPVAFFLCCADIPFFGTFNMRLNATALNWSSSPLFVVKMIFQEWHYLVFLFLFVGTSALFIFLQRRTVKRFIRLATAEDRSHKIKTASLCILFVGTEILGIRGRIDEKSPLVAGTAYFCRYDIANQAGLNPVFTFIQSWLDTQKDGEKKLHLMRDHEAIKLSRYYLGISDSNSIAGFPFARIERSAEPQHRYNLVVVLMESMSAHYMERYGNKLHLTPNLDTLAAKGISFDNCYSAGIHTYNGIYSTLYGYPALLDKHTMEGVNIPEMSGLPLFFRQRGYRTLYFTTHDDQFDNVGGFLAKNGVDTIISKKDYPSSAVLSTLGVPDHFMFDYALPALSDASTDGNLFCAFIMTASNHNPYIVPKDIPFRPANDSIRGGCVEYADWAIGQFMKNASAQKWFGNTIFVFVADHGTITGDAYEDVRMGYNHIPLIIYAPGLLGGRRVINTLAGQIDIFPTVAGYFGGTYINNTPGVDLTKTTRDFMFFCEDNKLAVTDNKLICIWHKDGRQGTYILKNTVSAPAAGKHVDSMKQFAFSILQGSQYVLQNHMSGIVKPAQH